MDNEFDVIEHYKKDREIKDENKYLLIGIGILTIAAILDWELFLWIFSIVKTSH
jgi:hypothetical protein